MLTKSIRWGVAIIGTAAILAVCLSFGPDAPFGLFLMPGFAISALLTATGVVP